MPQNFIGYITHVIDSKYFYVITHDDLQKINTELPDHENLEKYFWLPAVDEFFLIIMPDEPILRAKRTKRTEKNMIDFYLLDTGEAMQFSYQDVEKMKLFKMPNHLQEIPPGAFRCVLTTKSKYLQQDPNFLESSIYEKFTIKVLSVEQDGTLHVDLEKYENIDLNLKPIVKQENENSNNENEVDKFKECLEKNDPIIFDAQVAVQGFHTNDDKRRCKFYNHSTDECWKKGRCKQQHMADLVDGTCRDKKLVHVFDINGPSQPKRNFFYSIKIVSFINLNRFMGYFINKGSIQEIYHGKTLNELREKLNSGSFKKLTMLPAVGELVTVKIKDKFFRAQIEEEIDDFMTFPVGLVDEGRFNVRVSYNDLYEYCVSLQDFPFFAVEFTIADIEPLKSNPRDKEAQNYILTVQEHDGPLKALIV